MSSDGVYCKFVLLGEAIDQGALTAARRIVLSQKVVEYRDAQLLYPPVIG